VAGEGFTELYQTARAAWPKVELDAPRFIAWARERADDADGVHAADLYLACACAQGEPRALAEFEKRYLSEVPSYLARMDVSRATVDEVQQRLREKLLIGTPPRIADYSGRGPLGGWMRVVAIRTALDLARAEKPHAPLDEDGPLALASPAPDPELDYIKTRYRKEFKTAFQAALSQLEKRERNVLKLHFIDGLGIDEIGAFYRVHRATVARWLARVRQILLEQTRKALAEKLRLGESELESLMALVQSQLEVSIKRYLKK
jgi:RNA polymerase sigma-70 factor (ECF subfamily)